MTTSNPNAEIVWGRRAHHGTWLHFFINASIMFFTPLMVIFYWTALHSYDGSLSQAMTTLFNIGPVEFFTIHFPKPDLTAAKYYAAWLLFQVGLYQFLPGDLNSGQLTPAGFLLKYRTNGLLAWIVSHILYFAASYTGYLDPAIIPKHWDGLIFAANVAGYILTTFAFLKAHFAPTHPTDRKFSGSHIYDYYMGIELNPRIGNFDFKLYTNGRPGIVAWTLM